MADITCPALADVKSAEECLENLAGLAATAYVGLKDDLSEAMVLTDNVYSTPKFKSGKGLYKFELQTESQSIEGSSLGRRKGFSLTLNFVFEAVSKAIGKNARALNNLDLFFIIKDGEESQILYDPNYKVTFDSDGIKTSTGAAASDDRNTTCAAKLQPVLYPNLYVTEPTESGWDSLLASAATTGA